MNDDTDDEKEITALEKKYEEERMSLERLNKEKPLIREEEVLDYIHQDIFSGFSALRYDAEQSGMRKKRSPGDCFQDNI